MPARPRPTVRLRRLAGSLRRIRENHELSREDVAEATGINKATLYRIETAKVRPQARTLVALLNLYEVTGDERAGLTQLLKDSAQAGWLRSYTEELPEEYGAYIEFEDEAAVISNYESLFIPGLLQTEAYAHALIRGVLPTATRDQIEQRVEVRMKRQAVLERPQPLKLWAICDEAALRREVGGRTVMRDQLLHLTSRMELPHVTLQVLPYGVGAHPGMPGSFMVLTFADDPSVVYIDSMAGDLFLEEPAEVRRYSGLYEHLRALADNPDATMQLLTRVASEL
jgi:transcriptional regulator with XRE-family HTH domain